MRTASRRAVGAVAALLIVLVSGAGCTPRSEESISSYDVRIAVRADATLAVTEIIVYDFGKNRKHGIFRTIVLRSRYGWRSDRLSRVDGATATMDGAEVPVSSRVENGSEVIAAGDPAGTVSGTHTYVLHYTVHDVLDRTADGPRLSWIAVGADWQVHIAAVTVTVTGPAAPGRVRCSVGSQNDSDRCAEAGTAGDTATFRDNDLHSGTVMTVAVGYPPGSVVVSDPVLVDRAWLRWLRSVPGRFRPTVGVVVGTLALAVVIVVAGCWPYWRVLRYGGKPRRGWGRLAWSLPLRLPARLPPAVLGAETSMWWDQSVGVTVVDLAVRGHLRVEEVTGAADGPPTAWELVRVSGDGTLMPYEQTALDLLFAAGGRIRIGEPGTLRDKSYQLDCQLFEDCRDRRWFRSDPVADVDWVWKTVTWLAALATVALTIWTHVALLAVGPLVAGVVVWVTTRYGDDSGGLHEAILRRRAEIAQALGATSVEAIPVEDRGERFSRDLPYAIGAGRSDEWIDLFAGVLDAPGSELPWYCRSTPPGPGLVDAVRGFIAATLVSSKPAPRTGSSDSSSSRSGSSYRSGHSSSYSSGSSSSSYGYGGSWSTGGGGSSSTGGGGSW